MTPHEQEWLDSGPYCIHWNDPADCEAMCVCGHMCCQHENDKCNLCSCKKFKEDKK